MKYKKFPHYQDWILKVNFTHYQTSREFLWNAYKPACCVLYFIFLGVRYVHFLYDVMTCVGGAPCDDQMTIRTWCVSGTQVIRSWDERGETDMRERVTTTGILLPSLSHPASDWSLHPTHASDWLTESYTHPGGRVGDKHCYVVSTCHKLVTGRWGVSAIRRWAVKMNSS